MNTLQKTPVMVRWFTMLICVGAALLMMAFTTPESTPELADHHAPVAQGDDASMSIAQSSKKKAKRGKARSVQVSPGNTGGPSAQRGYCCTQSQNGTWGCAGAANGSSSCINGATYFENDPRVD